MSPLRALVFQGPGPLRAGRTVRGLRGRGLTSIDVSLLRGDALAAAFEDGPLWLLRGGAWPVSGEPPVAPPPSSTGQPLCALGRTWAFDGGPPPGAALEWDEALRRTGGDFNAPHARGGLPPVDSAYLEAPVGRVLAARLRAGEPWQRALESAIESTKARAVRISRFDVADAAALRVAQVVTSAQQGGAERLAIDLASTLPEHGVTSRLFLLGRPSRKAFSVPAGTVDLSETRGPWEARLRRLNEELGHFGADVVHAHLLSLSDMRSLAAAGFPPVVTVHNMKPGWPPELGSIKAGDASLLVGCARAVEEDLRGAALPVPSRSVWNGIKIAGQGSSSERERARGALEIAPHALVLLALANPRPQKRLDRLPAIVAELRRALRGRGPSPEVLLLIAGDPAPRSEAGKQALSDLCAEIDRHGVKQHVRLLGSVDPVRPLLCAADALVSPSAHEGLSLAHLEALSVGLPVIASGTGGTEEVSRLTGALTFLPEGWSPADFAQAVIRAVDVRDGSGPRVVSRHFTLSAMTERYAQLYARAAARPSEERRPGEQRPGEQRPGLVLVTNNFSTGGAQSSGRRLLLGLAEQGIPVRAVVLEEQPDHPTPGRRALLEAGIEVLSLPPASRRDAGLATRRIVDWIGEAKARAVVLWNALAEHKILLADALFDAALFDVSPGEMYFASLERYFSSPRAGLPYLSARDYGARLAGVIVKYEGERERAALTLGAPVHCVMNGVPVPEPAPARERRKVVIGTAARVHPHKKLEELLEGLRAALPRLPEVELRVAGGPDLGQEEYFESLRRGAADLPVVFLGETAGSEAFLRDLDVFALVAEPAGCPNASLEAMAAGLPVIATDVGGVREQIIDGESGRLTPKGDPAALGEALSEVCNDAALRRRLGRAARQRAIERFSLGRMVQDYKEIFFRSGASGP